MSLNKTKILQRGDTIIEVLLAMSVIGLVLGSSYAIANRSLRIGREAQERTEALKITETQLERLRTVSGVRGNALVDFDPNDSAFCIDSSIDPVLFADRPDFNSFTEIVTDEVTYPDGPDSDQPCNQGTEGRYGVTITRSTTTDDYLYTVRVRWESLGGGPLQELQSQYRVYPVGNTAFESITPAPTPGPDPSTLCQDSAGGATNVGSPLPCEYPPAPDPPTFFSTSVYGINNTRVDLLTYISGLTLNDDDVDETGHIYIQGNDTSITLDSTGIAKVIDTNDGEAGLAIDNRITGLTRNTEYTVRSYITRSGVDFYGTARTFTTANSFQIGDTGPGGGRVFYNKGNNGGGWQYMEAFATNVERFMGCSDPPSQLSAQIGDGPGNNSVMVPLCGSGSPFGYADSFVRSGEDDWFIPAYHELNRLITNQSAAGVNLNGTYWTSSTSSGSWTNYFYALSDDRNNDSGARAGSSTRFKIVVVRRF